MDAVFRPTGRRRLTESTSSGVDAVHEPSLPTKRNTKGRARTSKRRQVAVDGGETATDVVTTEESCLSRGSTVRLPVGIQRPGELPSDSLAAHDIEQGGAASNEDRLTRMEATIATLVECFQRQSERCQLASNDISDRAPSQSAPSAHLDHAERGTPPGFPWDTTDDVTRPPTHGWGISAGQPDPSMHRAPPVNINNNSTLASAGTPADQLKHIAVVSPQLKKDIIAGKDVNLACLLIPNYSQQRDGRQFTLDEDTILLKPMSDNRLTRSLSIQEFITAFSVYRNVMCEAYPNRREELDSYLREIIEMSSRFGGTGFYDYHRAFSAKAASYLLNHRIKVDWSQRDTKLFTTIFSGQRPAGCRYCSSFMHTSDFCIHAQSTSCGEFQVPPENI